jgi:hypothetical protein
MELSSHVISNLDQWVENGFINIEQREAIAQLMQGVVEDAYHCGADDSADDGYDSGWSDGYESARAEWESQRDEWFEQGWAEALLEHGIEE